MTNILTPDSLAAMLNLLPKISLHHSRSTEIYRVLDERAKELISASELTKASEEVIDLGVFGSISFPYVQMGAISTLDLFGLDELIIFAFYWSNRERYQKVADIGANLGIHSILMSKCGWQVSAYEPDPDHVKVLRRNLVLNQCNSVDVIEAAVSNEPGVLEFVRVLGNTTSSHLVNAKDNAYGPMERFPVRVEGIGDLMANADLVKMDAEGQERSIILGTISDNWDKTDMMVEIGSEKNAIDIYEHLQSMGVNAFAQKLGWNRVEAVEDMPMHYTHGSLFVTKNIAMPWIES